jgi:hypothetical protein
VLSLYTSLQPACTTGCSHLGAHSRRVYAVICPPMSPAMNETTNPAHVACLLLPHTQLLVLGSSGQTQVDSTVRGGAPVFTSFKYGQGMRSDLV